MILCFERYIDEGYNPTVISLCWMICHVMCEGLGDCETVKMTDQTLGWVRVAIRCALLMEDVSSRKGS
jgi:hypothetical protein